MDLHIKAYHLNHWLLSLYAFDDIHYSVTLLSRRWNPFPGVCSDLDIELKQETRVMVDAILNKLQDEVLYAMRKPTLNMGGFRVAQELKI